MKFEAVLWDLDGTLLQSAASIGIAMNQVFREMGLDNLDDDELRKHIGRPLRDILGDYIDDQAAIEDMTHRYRAVYNQHAWQFVEFYPDVEAGLAEIQAAGVKQGVVTTKGQEEARILLRDLRIDQYFDVIIGDDDARPLKPDPAPVLAALATLGIESSRAAMVGDTHFDILAGKAAGCQAIAVTWGHGYRDELVAAGADVIAEAISEVVQAVL